MKRCPQCNRVETDELVFCRSDGTPLVSHSSLVNDETGTAKLSSARTGEEIETSILPHTTDAASSRGTGPTTGLAVQPPATTGTLAKPRRTTVIAAVVIVTAAVAAVAALVLNSYLSRNSHATIQSIAVMPFVNESGNADVEYLSDGMTETLISSLSQLPNLSVKARSTVFYYKGKETSPKKIGEDLNVQAILLGRVAQRGNDIKLSLELVNTRTQDVIWSEQYNRKQTDLVTLQREIARDVSGKLKSKLSGADMAKVEKNYTANAEAYQLYLKGRFQWNRRTAESLRQAAELYKQAIAKDPNYAVAYSGLAETYVLYSAYSVASPKDSMPLAKAMALRALEIDEQLAEAHAALGLYLNYFEWDRVGAEKELRRAIELKPNYATAHHWLASDFLVQLKRFDEALVEIRRAEELDPLSPIIGTNIGDSFLFARRYDEAIAQYKRVLTVDPNFQYAHIELGYCFDAKGMYREAIAEYRKGLELGYDPAYNGYLALSLAKSGRRDEAVNLLNQLKQESSERYVPSYAIGIIYLGLGEKEEALNWLEKDIAEHSTQATYYAVVPELDELRPDPRFKEMLKRLNLPE